MTTATDPALLTRELLAVSLPGLSDRDLDRLAVCTHGELQDRLSDVLSRGLTDAQLTEFDALVDDDGAERRCEQWLEDNVPHHRTSVVTVRAHLVAEVIEAVATADPATVTAPRAGIGIADMDRAQHHRPESDDSPTGPVPHANPRCPCSGAVTSPTDRPKLGEREREALLNWLHHDSKRAAAAQMYVTESTLSTHIERIRRKYDALGRPAPTKSAMLIRAIQDGLIDIDEF